MYEENVMKILQYNFHIKYQGSGATAIDMIYLRNRDGGVGAGGVGRERGLT